MQSQEGPIEGAHLCDVAASFQQAVIEVLCKKTLRAARDTGLERIVVAGGVACNKGLRALMGEEAAKQGLQVFFPSPILCADNAAMLGVAGDAYLTAGCIADLDLNARANWPLDQAGRSQQP